MSKKQKFYVVWKGHKTGIFNSWEDCKKQVEGFVGAQYKSFRDQVAAKKAYKKKYSDYKGKDTKKKKLTKAEKAKYGEPILKSLIGRCSM